MIEYAVITAIIVGALSMPFPNAGDPSVIQRMATAIKESYKNYSYVISLPTLP